MPKAVSKYYPAYDGIPQKETVVARPMKLRSSITPGTVLILLAGRFQGKRVIFLKQLESGLLLVTGPFKVNGVPLRRVNQAYVIATSTKVDLSNLVLPENINDAYFKCIEEKKPRDEAFFNQEIKPVVIPEERKNDQNIVDTALLQNIKKTKFLKYLSSRFRLTKYDRPHLMKF